MRTLDEIRKILKEQRELLAEKYGIAVVGIFGSQLRGESKSDSDLDLLADILRPISLLEMVGADLYLSETLGIKVDLVPKRSLRKELKEGILKEAIVP